MAESSISTAATTARQIYPSWNMGLVVASISVSLLGAFTSTQLMCQARASRTIVAVTVWTALASLTFGFCSIWCLHFVAMLACELDVKVGLDVTLSILSALLAVAFTFMALAGDRIWERHCKQKLMRARGRTLETLYQSLQRRAATPTRRDSSEILLERDHHTSNFLDFRQSSPLKLKQAHHRLISDSVEGPVSPYTDVPESRFQSVDKVIFTTTTTTTTTTSSTRLSSDSQHNLKFATGTRADSAHEDLEDYIMSDTSGSRRGSGFSDSDGSFALGTFNSIRVFTDKAFAGKNAFTVTATMLWTGLIWQNVIKGFVWSLAITLMHYLGIVSMKIPEGHFMLDAPLVLLSAVISWTVCTVGCVLMSSMETNLGQQLLFSAVASSGVAAMHYTGMSATKFYTRSPPTTNGSYPSSLPLVIGTIAIITCLAANGLLAHSATVARNKLAEIVRTRKKLWAAIAQKENAEAAAIARSEFIASASHEIRTPLHQLQGYSDLMARCSLPEDARLLLAAIQDATKTLSLVTNNVLDWSRLEKGEAVCELTNLDVRNACDALVKLLPRRDDDLEVELLVVVSPDVPQLILFDETYFHRIVMNLVSNALKFTTTGYVLVMLDFNENKLVITVSDTGVGIPASFLPELYEPFKQAQTRGAERGTGLGLSIVKQLLNKVEADIQVESRHQDAEGVGPTRCGSKFTVSIPIQESKCSTNTNRSIPETRHQLAFFEPFPTRVMEGFKMAWDKFGVEVFPARHISDLTKTTKYVYLNTKLLEQDDALRAALSQRDDITVLVPCDAEKSLPVTMGATPPPNFMMIQRPWMFHAIMQNGIDDIRRLGRSDSDHRTVRFASKVDVLSVNTQVIQHSTIPEQAPQPSPPEPLNEHNDLHKESVLTILLVEDNKINQKLGIKMLKILGYNNVIVAGDGQEAIDILIANPKTIDIILMDQSMPIKDGLTATKEIRELEERGAIASADRWQNNGQLRNRRPIIAVTAVVGPQHEARCKIVGTDAFVPKPMSLKKLRETLEKFVTENNSQC